MNELPVPHLSVGDLSRATGLAPGTVRLYADTGLLACARDSAGRRVFAAGAIEQARAVHAERMARRSANLLLARTRGERAA